MKRSHLIGLATLVGILVASAGFLGMRSQVDAHPRPIPKPNTVSVSRGDIYLTVTARPDLPAGLLTPASWGFVVGALSMPFCCLVKAHVPSLQAIFVLPVGSLISAGCLTLWMLMSP